MQVSKEEFINKYGDALVEFVSYYKFNFTYKGEFEGNVIKVTTGGNSADIYKDDVVAGAKVSVACLYPYAGSILKDGVEIESFFDY